MVAKKFDFEELLCWKILHATVDERELSEGLIPKSSESIAISNVSQDALEECIDKLETIGKLINDSSKSKTSLEQWPEKAAPIVKEIFNLPIGAIGERTDMTLKVARCVLLYLGFSIRNRLRGGKELLINAWKESRQTGKSIEELLLQNGFFENIFYATTKPDTRLIDRTERTRDPAKHDLNYIKRRIRILMAV